MLSVNLDGTSPWLSSARPVQLHHLIKAHALLSMAPLQVVDRLTALGFAMAEMPVPAYPDLRDVALLRNQGFGEKFLDPDQAVPLAHVVKVARKLSISIVAAAARLRELGMIVDLTTAIRDALARVPLQR